MVVSMPVRDGDRPRRRCSAARSSRCRRSISPCRAESRPARPAPPAGRRRCRDGDAAAQQPSCSPNSARLVAHLGQQRAGMPNRRSRSPSQLARWMSNSSVREALVASVAWTRRPSAARAGSCRSCRRPARPAPRGARAPARGPAARRSWWRRNTGRAAARCARCTSGSGPSALQPGAGIGGAAVLPDDRAVHGLAGRAVPQHHGLALVGDADGARCAAPAARQRLARRGQRVAPDILRVVLHPARCRVMLRRTRAGRVATGRPSRLEDDRAGGGGALVDGEHVIGLSQRCSPSSGWLRRCIARSSADCGAVSRRPSLERRHSTSSAVRAHSSRTR